MDEELRGQIAEALRDTGRYGPGFTVLRQAVSGSRQNYLLHADDSHDQRTAVLWCRATYETIDDSFAGRFTLAREEAILRRLAPLPVRVPQILGSSASGRALIQAYIDEREPADAAVREHDIEKFFAELDRVNSLDPSGIVPPDELSALSTPTDAVRVEVAAWSELAQQLLASDRLAMVEQQAIVPSIVRRVADVLSLFRAVHIPDVGPDFDLVHGDAGRANYIADRTGEIWVIDFELAHAGSRLEDYAWCELRGLEQDNDVWRRHVIARLGQMPGTSAEAYRYFRMLIYFRSVIAIAARIAADPAHAFNAYLARRFAENETLGWLSAAALPAADVPAGSTAVGDPSAAFTPDTLVRLHSWQHWTESIDALVQGRDR